MPLLLNSNSAAIAEVNPYVTYHAAGMEFSANTPYDVWASTLGTLQRIAGSVQWWIGDALNFGEARYGETYAQALDETALDYGYLRNLKWVSGQYELSHRCDNLSWSHHREVADLEPTERQDWLTQAEEHQWSVAEMQRARSHAIAEALREELPPAPDGPFRVIVADPPWAYEKRHQDDSHRGRTPYPNMTADEIAALPVASLAHDDCILWLWTTNAHMREAYDVAAAWGFTVKTILTWEKDRMGTGDWLRGQTEHCLLAVRGRPKVILTGQTTILHAPRLEHSEKPEAFYQLVDELCPGSKAEIFARRQRIGWVTHGSEISGTTA